MRMSSVDDIADFIGITAGLECFAFDLEALSDTVPCPVKSNLVFAGNVLHSGGYGVPREADLNPTSTDFTDEPHITNRQVVIRPL